MTHGTPEQPSWRAGLVRAVRLYFAPFVRVDPVADKEAGPFAQRFQRWALAAAAVAGAGIGVHQFLSQPPFTMSIVTAANQWSSKALPEQSVVNVRPGTNMTVRLDDQERRIDILRGEALFEVAHEEPSRPFIVYAGTTQTRAVGTQFVVTYEPSGNVKVSVVEGRVRFKNVLSNGDFEERSLPAGAGASVANGQMSGFSFSSYDAIRRVFWKDDTLHMSGATIGEVVARLNVREPQQIVIDDPRIAATLLPSTFVTQYTLDKFLSLIEGTQPLIEVQRRDGVAHLMFKAHSPIRPEAHAEQQHRDGRG